MWFGSTRSEALAAIMPHNGSTSTSLTVFGSTDPPLSVLVSEPHEFVILYARETLP